MSGSSIYTVVKNKKGDDVLSFTCPEPPRESCTSIFLVPASHEDPGWRIVLFRDNHKDRTAVPTFSTPAGKTDYGLRCPAARLADVINLVGEERFEDCVARKTATETCGVMGKHLSELTRSAVFRTSEHPSWCSPTPRVTLQFFTVHVISRSTLERLVQTFTCENYPDAELCDPVAVPFTDPPTGSTIGWTLIDPKVPNGMVLRTFFRKFVFGDPTLGPQLASLFADVTREYWHL